MDYAEEQKTTLIKPKYGKYVTFGAVTVAVILLIVIFATTNKFSAAPTGALIAAPAPTPEITGTPATPATPTLPVSTPAPATQPSNKTLSSVSLIPNFILGGAIGGGGGGGSVS
ncbi:TPA: hypothetical protein H1005_00985 [archaeon]|uniref:Uncharacterized protein n=1 Tax=Candidatus Naiadarchaeum limnaeum TaxID=2756139 RepID=A0A832V2M5_9ARCH|nr:hypothetical protein [Candidatus Naiadarchaeales archaeon SRR2090153.bin1042]HIK00883.1 hypothetical protein [Candidatus Naiadarchaeum limnaeum]